MSRQSGPNDEPDGGVFEDEPLDPEGPSPEDIERFGDEHVTCPACKAAVYDQTDLCPECGHALLAPPSGPSIWVILTGLLVLVAFLLLILN